MLIGLVRDSVMQCFCHSCRAPVLPAGDGAGAGFYAATFTPLPLQGPKNHTNLCLFLDFAADKRVLSFC